MDIVERLKELAETVTQGRDAVSREFTMRVPAEPERDADLVLSRAADEIARLRATAKAVVDHWRAPVSKKPGSLNERMNALEQELGEVTDDARKSAARERAKGRLFENILRLEDEVALLRAALEDSKRSEKEGWRHADELEQERKRLRDENAKPRASVDEHDSDCATHNEPAYPNGPCDCSEAMQKEE